MSNVQQLSDDLSFVRTAVARRGHAATPASILLLWATYVLVGYTLIDFAPAVAGWWLMIAGFTFGAASSWLGRRAAVRAGELDREQGRREAMHWGAGIILAIVAAFGLAVAIPPLRGPIGSQVLVVMIGLVYFLAGVHFDRHFLWLGPVLMVGGITVGFIPRYPWTWLGAVIAAGLVVPIFFRRPASQADAPAQAA